jgi:uncharacterized protein YndB with AHSA1/START domain
MGMPILEGENLEVEPPRRLVQSFRALWGEDVKSEGTSRVTWEIEPVGDSCLLRVTHDQLPEDANQQLYGGWPMILSGIKTARDGRDAHYARIAAVDGERDGAFDWGRPLETMMIRSCGTRASRADQGFAQ